MAQNFLPRLSKKNFLAKDVKVDYFQNREEKFRKYLTKIDDSSLVYFYDVQGLMDELKPGVYKDEEWRPFIDSSKRSLKGVLLHKTNNKLSKASKKYGQKFSYMQKYLGTNLKKDLESAHQTPLLIFKTPHKIKNLPSPWVPFFLPSQVI